MSEQENQKLDEIHRALVGEDRYGREGLIKKVERHETWINNANLRIAGIMGGSVVACFAFNKAWEWITGK